MTDGFLFWVAGVVVCWCCWCRCAAVSLCCCVYRIHRFPTRDSGEDPVERVTVRICRVIDAGCVFGFGRVEFVGVECVED